MYFKLYENMDNRQLQRAHHLNELKVALKCPAASTETACLFNAVQIAQTCPICIAETVQTSQFVRNDTLGIGK
jgi:predicted Zn-ribbon and HTH transcriptional regulator